jgi:hypothetical protein
MGVHGGGCAPEGSVVDMALTTAERIEEIGEDGGEMGKRPSSDEHAR